MKKKFKRDKQKNLCNKSMKKLKLRRKKVSKSKERMPSEAEDVDIAGEATEAGPITMIEEGEPAILDTTRIKKAKVDKINISKTTIVEGVEEVVAEGAMMVKKEESTTDREIEVMEDRIRSSGIGILKSLKVQTTTSKLCRKKEPKTTIIKDDSSNSTEMDINIKIEEGEVIIEAEETAKAITRAEAEVNIAVEEVEEDEELITNSVQVTTKRIIQTIINSQRESMIRRTIRAMRKKITNIRRLEHEVNLR